MPKTFKQAIVVGASSGIGEAIAVRLAKPDTRIALLGRRTSELERVAQAVRAAGAEALVVPHDVTDFAAIPGLFDRLLRELGGLDLLVYAAGVMPSLAESEYDFAKDRLMMDVNALGAIAWCDPTAALFEKQRMGTILGISSIAGERGRRGNPVYTTSKAALTTYLEALRNRLSRYGVSVVTVKPGFVDTRMTQGMPGLLWLISADEAARRALALAESGRSRQGFVPGRWALVALIIRSIPSFLFRRLNIYPVIPTEPLINAPQRVFDGFGQSVRAACRSFRPTERDDISALFARARAEGMSVALRGSGRSYGDASLNDRALVLDLSTWNRVLSWDRQSGIVEVEPGVTIGDLWRHTLPDGYWPAVVPGTMAPTLGGCLAMNIHGKNNFNTGPIGEHVLDFDLLTTGGEVLRCSREQNADVFHAAIGGFGMLGAFTRIRLQQKRVHSGLLRVEQMTARSLDETFALFEERLPRADYLVGWLDALAGGAGLGRSVVHQANYLAASDDPEGGNRTLRLDRQGLPSRLFGVPRGELWRFMKPLTNDLGLRLLNWGKYWAAVLAPGSRIYRQSHTAFAFLFDYLPNWRRIYEPRGFIQIQPFVPAAAARATFGEILRLCQQQGLPPYLVVLKRHRPDPFLLTHALDGYSLAMDFAVPVERARLWQLGHRLIDLVLDRGGKFYFAKDSLLRPRDVERIYGPERLAAFRALKRRLDPQATLQTDLGRRVAIAL